MTKGKVEILDWQKQEKWDSLKSDFVDINDICFSYGYHRLYQTENCRPENFCYRDQNKIFSIAYLRQPISNSVYFDFETVYGYSGPLANNNDNNFLKNAWSYFLKYCENEGIICGFIRFNPLADNHLLVLSEYVQVEKVKEIVVSTIKGKNEQDIWAQYTSNTRNKIKLAQKHNIKIHHFNTQEALLIFKDIYYQTMDRLKADSFYYFDDAFLKRIYKYLKDNFVVFIAYLEEKVVGGALIFFTREVVYYFLSASLGEGRQCGAANLLRHEAASFARRQDIRMINFGGGKTSEQNDSLFKFKKGFSKETKDFYIGKVLVNEKEYSRLCKEWWDTSSLKQREENGCNFLKYRG